MSKNYIPSEEAQNAIVTHFKLPPDQVQAGVTVGMHPHGVMTVNVSIALTPDDLVAIGRLVGDPEPAEPAQQPAPAPNPAPSALGGLPRHRMPLDGGTAITKKRIPL